MQAGRLALGLLSLGLLCLLPHLGFADTVVAARTIRAQSVLSATDLAFKDIDVAGGVNDASELVGKETRVALYAGRPIRLTDVGPPALVARNQLVQIVFQAHGLSITTEGRSLGRAGLGENVRVMNISSRTTIFGIVGPDGRVFVSY